MSGNNENFLDSKTLFAVFCLGLAWLGWNYYMKQKYPEHFQKKPAEIQSKEPLKAQEKSPPPFHAFLNEVKKGLNKESFKEKELFFEGENFNIVFSSLGFGIKSLSLKKHYDRNGKQIEFIAEGPARFFASSLPELGPEALPFEIKKEGEDFVGSFSFSGAEIQKRIKVDDSKFIIHVETKILPKKLGKIPDLKLDFSHPLPEKSSGFFKMFYFYSLDMLKAFVFYEGKESKNLKEADLSDCKTEECPSYFKVQAMGLGGKYFGKAFINKSKILPSAIFSRSENKASASILYKFFHSKEQKLEYQIFLGPKSLKTLEEAGRDLKLWLDFGFFGWLARPLLIFLMFIQAFCLNWGLAIIFLTVFIRLLLLPINIKSSRSMKLLQKIQPEMKKIRDEYKSDPKLMNQKVMALMKEHKANPLGGFLPLFIQFPVFLALYRVLGESIELYQSPFIFWIQDLSLKDPYYILPILGGLILFIQQSLTPTNLPKEQARLLKLMPLVFSLFMLGLPSGLTLYIFVSGLFGLAQQYFLIYEKKSKS